MALLQLIARLGLDTSQFQSGLDRSKGMAQTWGNDVGQQIQSRLAMFLGPAAITALVKSQIEKGGWIQDMADQFQITTTQVQRMEFAAKKAGLQFEFVANAMDKVAKKQLELKRSGDQKGIGDLMALSGKSKDQVLSMNYVDLFQAILANQPNLPATSENRARLQELGFKQGGKLSALRGGFGERAPGEYTPGQAKMLDELGDRMAGYGSGMGKGFLKFLMLEQAPFVRALLGPNMPLIGGLADVVEARTAVYQSEVTKADAEEQHRKLLGAKEEAVRSEANAQAEANDALGSMLGVWASDLPAAKRKPQSLVEQSADALSKLGMFTGLSGGSETVQISREQLARLEEIVRNTDRLREASGDITGL